MVEVWLNQIDAHIHSWTPDSWKIWMVGASTMEATIGDAMPHKSSSSPIGWSGRLSTRTTPPTTIEGATRA
jgi:hypothetical protein